MSHCGGWRPPKTPTPWFLALQDFRFRVEHRPGREHANADALSRREAYLTWVEDDPGLRPGGKVCDVPRPPRALRGVVVDGVYRRQPPAGAKEHTLGGSHQGNARHLGWHREQVSHRHKSRETPHGWGENMGRARTSGRRVWQRHGPRNDPVPAHRIRDQARFRGVPGSRRPCYSLRVE